MTDRCRRASEYTPELTALARATCLYLATRLGDVMDDLVLVGGLVPSLLIPPEHFPEDAEAHVGTRDVDLGFRLAILDRLRYRTLAARLREAGFQPDANKAGNPTRQRWLCEAAKGVTLDFLIPPASPDDEGGTLQNLEADFAAIITPGLHLAFEDRVDVELSGKTLLGEQATRAVPVSGPGAYTVLKSLAFDSRGAEKDAYDLYWVLRHYGAGVQDVARRLRPLLPDPHACRALEILERDFLSLDSVGPRRVAVFQTGSPDDDIQADVVGLVGALIAELQG